jgi:hypothetical protein
VAHVPDPPPHSLPLAWVLLLLLLLLPLPLRELLAPNRSTPSPPLCVPMTFCPPPPTPRPHYQRSHPACRIALKRHHRPLHGVPSFPHPPFQISGATSSLSFSWSCRTIPVSPSTTDAVRHRAASTTSPPIARFGEPPPYSCCLAPSAWSPQARASHRSTPHRPSRRQPPCHLTCTAHGDHRGSALAPHRYHGPAGPFWPLGQDSTTRPRVRISPIQFLGLSFFQNWVSFKYS